MIGFANFQNIKYHCIKVILGYEGKYVNLYQSDRTYHTRVVMDILCWFFLMMSLLQILINIWVGGLIKMEQVYRKQIQHPRLQKYFKLQYSLIYNSSIEVIEISWYKNLTNTVIPSYNNACCIACHYNALYLRKLTYPDFQSLFIVKFFMSFEFRKNIIEDF